jgi:hypothetical protein
VIFFRLPQLAPCEFYRVELNSGGVTRSIPAATPADAKRVARELLNTTLFAPVKIYAVHRDTGDRRLVKTLKR